MYDDSTWPRDPASAALPPSPGEGATDDRARGDEGLERLVDRTLHESMQRASDLRKLTEMLTLMLQRLQVQALRIESDLATARAERSRLQRELAERREQVQLALWEVRQREREAEGARTRLATELEARRQVAEEEARRIRSEAEREAAELLAEAQRRRTEMLAAVDAWWPEQAVPGQPLGGSAPPQVLPAAPGPERARPLRLVGEPSSSGAADVASGALSAAPASAAPDGPPVASTQPPAGASAGGGAAGLRETAPEHQARVQGEQSPQRGDHGLPPSAARLTELVFLRVPDTRAAAALQAAISGLEGVTDCRLREFERGRLVLEVEHALGAALADHVRALDTVDLRLTSARDGRLEFQFL